MVTSNRLAKVVKTLIALMVVVAITMFPVMFNNKVALAGMTVPSGGIYPPIRDYGTDEFGNSVLCGVQGDCIPGGPRGGSQIQATMGYRQSGTTITPTITFRIVGDGWEHLGLGCYIDQNGDGYLLRALSAKFVAMDTSANKKEINLTARLNCQLSANCFLTVDPNVPTVYEFNPVSIYDFDPGVTYKLTGTYQRRHICSQSPDKDVIATQAEFNRQPEWAVSGQSYIWSSADSTWRQGTTLKHVRPGQYLYWNHQLFNKGLVNTGNEHMNEDVTINVDNIKYSIATGAVTDAQYSSPSGIRDRGDDDPEEPFFNQNTGPIQVQQSDVGKRICQRVAWQKKAWNDESWGTSTWACADVEYHYPDPNGINMTVTSNKTTIQPGDNVTFNYTITAKSGPTKTRDIQYRTYTFIIPGSNSLPSNKDQTAYYNPAWSYVECGGRSVPSSSQSYCAQGHSGSTGELAPITGIKTDSNTYTIDGNWAGQPGDQICSYIAADNNWSVNNGQSASTYIASKIYCVRIGKKPQIQINGADSYAKSGFTGSSYYASSLSANRGSYSQYGLLTGSSAAITNFGSAGYTTVNSTNATKAKTLAFANVGSSLGNAGINNSLSLPVSPSSTQNLSGTSLNINSLNGSSDVKYYHSSASNLTITGGNLNAGTYAVLFVDGNVTITGNITYGGGENASYSSLANIPNLTIIANNIYVNGNVTYLFGNYVARNGAFNTCSNMNNLGTAGNCANKLKINGAVISKGSPVLRRVFGSGNSTTVNQWTNNTVTASSEWFNYTPNTWLTPYLKNKDNSVTGFTTMNITSLPARY